MPGISEALSALPALEPIFGASLAINLAYLNLSKFRYRNHISRLAGKLLHSGGGLDTEAINDAEWFKQIKSLSEQEAYPKTQLKLPWDPWAYLYRVFFHWRVDRGVSAIASLLSAIYLVLTASVCFKIA